jgi:transcriptional regulator GlxA family with amidase domain
MTENDGLLPTSDMRMQPRTIGFLLVPGFALMSYASAIEPLRAANVLTGRNLYCWRHISTGEALVEASNGLSIVADHRIGEALQLDALLVCAGGNPAHFDHAPTLSWLRGLRRKPLMIGGVSGGPFLLARAGLLDGYRCTIHWEHASSFAEAFPHLSLMRTLYEIDGNRLTCAGGIAALDMMTMLIERHHGRALAREVAEWFLQTQARTGGGPQRMDPRERYGVANSHLIAALRAMETHLENPLRREQLAAAAGVGVRQLERLFAQHIGASISAHYLRLRLERAKSLLHQTALPVIEIAVACGFISASHFSRAFASQYSCSPRALRTGKRYTRPLKA